MGTRGIVGFRLDGIDKMAYNHWDSYPSQLGVSVVQQVRKMGEMHDIEDKVRAIIMLNEVNELDFSTEEGKLLFEAANKYLNLSVSRRSETDPYCLLREAQGNLLAYLEVGYMLDAHPFIYDSLSCEWGYIVNLDTMNLEVWKGYQCHPDRNNRYGCEAIDGFYPCKMIGEFDLEEVTEEQVVALDKRYVSDI